MAHDGGVLQTEAAIDLLLKGACPYGADYHGTDMERGVDSNPDLWKPLGFEENPAYRFYPYPPFTFPLSTPFCLASKVVRGWYDQRFVHILVLLALASASFLLPYTPKWRLPLMTLLVLNSMSALSFTLGMNDILCQTFVVITVLCLSRGHYRTSALLLGLSCGLRQFAWLLVPFYFAVLCARSPAIPGSGRLRRLASLTWPFCLATGACMVPFLLWSPQAFFHDLVLAQETLYPFRAEDLGSAPILALLRLIDHPRDTFPLYVLRAVVVLPLCAYGVACLWRRPALSGMVAWYGSCLLLFLFFGRHFAQDYFPIVFSMLALACVPIESISVQQAMRNQHEAVSLTSAT